MHARSHPKKSHASVRVTPAQEINKLYAQFLAMFRLVEQSYVQTLSNQSTTLVPVSTTLTAPYSAGSASIQVANPAVFGPEGAFAAPIIATAVIGAPVGTFSLIGSNSTQVAVNTAASSAVSLSNGTLLTASVPTTNTTSAGAIFPSYISASTQQLAVQLVAYFNSLPFKLPRMFAFPHQNQRSGAIQQYVYGLIAGPSRLSLEQTLLAIPLPQTPSYDLQIYDAAVNTALSASKLQMQSGVQQIFSGKLQVVPTGLSSSSSSSSSSGTGSTTSSSSSTTSSSGGTA